MDILILFIFILPLVILLVSSLYFYIHKIPSWVRWGVVEVEVGDGVEHVCRCDFGIPSPGHDFLMNQTVHLAHRLGHPVLAENSTGLQL